MKKRVLCILLGIMIMLLASACGKEAEEFQPQASTSEETEHQSQSSTSGEKENQLPSQGLEGSKYQLQPPTIEEVENWTDGLMEESEIHAEELTMKSSEESEGIYDTIWEDKAGNEIHVKFVDEIGGNNYQVLTEDHAGNPVTICHYYEDGTSGGWIKSDLYMLSYDAGLDSKPTRITVHTIDSLISESYVLHGEGYEKEDARYFDEEGYKIWNISEESFIVAESEKMPETCDKNLFSGLGNGEIYFVSGKHALTFTENDNVRNWYLTADFYVAFADLTEAENYAAAHGLKAKTWDYNDTIYVVDLDKLTLGLADDYQNLSGLIEDLFFADEAHTQAVIVDDTGKVKDIESHAPYLKLYD